MEEQLKNLALTLFEEAAKESVPLLKKEGKTANERSTRNPEGPQRRLLSDGAEEVEVTLKGLPATLTLDLDESFLSEVRIDVQFEHNGKSYEVKLSIQPRD